MFMYWTMFAIPALSALLRGEVGPPTSRGRFQPGLALLLVAFALVIGLRYEVGGDWFTYEEIVAYAGMEPLTTTLAYKDPGFGLIAWLSTRLGMGSYGASTFCGGVLMFGLWRFGRRQADNWLLIAASVPYLLIVVGMGYTRQAAALGFVLIALSDFGERSPFYFLRWLGVAILFHVSSILMLPLVIAALARRRVAAMIPLGILTFVAYVLVLRDRLDFMVEGYVNQEMDSSGAGVRLMMNAVPAVIFLLMRKRFAVSDVERALWSAFSLASLAVAAALLVSPATTALDRIGIYLIPIQLFVFGNLGPLVTDKGLGRFLVTSAIVVFYGVVLFVWLNFATHAQFWLPYRFAPLQG